MVQMVHRFERTCLKKTHDNFLITCVKVKLTRPKILVLERFLAVLGINTVFNPPEKLELLEQLPSAF